MGAKSSLARISNLLYVSRYTDTFQTLARVNRLRMYTLQKLEVNARLFLYFILCYCPGFHIPKIWYILKCFGRSFHQA